MAAAILDPGISNAGLRDLIRCSLHVSLDCSRMQAKRSCTEETKKTGDEVLFDNRKKHGMNTADPESFGFGVARQFQL